MNTHVNFENPSSANQVEREKRLPSLAEVQARLEAIIGNKDYVEVSRHEDEQGLISLEVIHTRENGDQDLYTYQRTGSDGEISAFYYTGTITDGEAKSGENLATYDSNTNTWRDIPKNVANESLPADVPRTENVPSRHPSPENQENGYQQLLIKFAEAESVFGTTSLEETIQRETDNYEAALERRAQTRPLLNAIYTELIRLNDDNSYPPQFKLTAWHASGQLTEAQFNELNSRRKHLAHLLGKLDGGKIRHDLNS